LRLPSRAEALGILEGAGCCGAVVDHCVSVAGVAVRLAGELQGRGVEVDAALVEAGALMHDLGRSETHGIEHAVVGGRIARGLGLPEALVRIIERHIGAGIPRGEAEEIGLPEGDYVPETLEEKLVAYADKLVEGGRVVEFDATLAKLKEELGENHPQLDRMRALGEEMAALLGAETSQF
jgi:uncharacterized protein